MLLWGEWGVEKVNQVEQKRTLCYHTCEKFIISYPTQPKHIIFAFGLISKLSQQSSVKFQNF